jgi:hypothetical protein
MSSTEVLSVASDAFSSAHHMVVGHLLVGDFTGFFKGITDYFVN